MWISGSRVFKSCAARKRFPAIELPSIVQRVGVPIRRGGAPGDCAARRVFFGFKYPYSKRVGSPVGRAGSSVLRDRAARKRFPAVELPSIVQRVGVPVRRVARTRPEIVSRGGRFPVSNVHIANEPALRVEGRLVCVPVICCYTCATGWPYRSSRRCRRTCRCPCGWT